MALFMGIDVGTSSLKALIIDEDGRELAVESHKYDVIYPSAGYAEQNPAIVWNTAIDVLSNLTSKNAALSKDIVAIGFSGQMHGLLMTDEHYNPVYNTIIWQDHRSNNQIEEIYNKIPRESFNRITLNQLSTGYLITSLLWMKENEPDAFKNIKHILLPKDFIRIKMCGGEGTDISDASATVIFDTAKRDWAWDLIDKLDLNRDIFPVCHESSEIAGYVSEECSKLTGLKKGIPVVYGGGDTLMHELGCGLVDGKQPWVSNIGTSCQISCIAESPVFDKLYRTNTFCCVKENLWMLMAVGMSGGSSMKWIQQIVGAPSFETMNEYAETVSAGSDGVIFLPYLSGSRCPENAPFSTGVFVGLKIEHSKQHLIRSVMEGVVYSLRSDLELLKEITGNDPDRIIASGGGARGKLFLQMQADIFNKPIYTTEAKEQACLGAAITAAVGTGYYSSYDAACAQTVRFNKEIIEPQRANVSKYNQMYGIYKEIYNSNEKIFEMSRSLNT